MMDDDKLLATFFAGHRQEIADNGFSRRVMRHLPDRTRRLSQLWTAFCFLLAVVLFVALDGATLIMNALRETFDAALQNGMAELDLRSLLIAAGILLIFLYRKVASLA